MTRRKIEYWVIPPEADAEFAAHLENVLEIYAKPYDPQHPVVCMDEQPVQLIGETRVAIPATKRHAKRVDYEYERRGTASILCSLNRSPRFAKRPRGRSAPSRTGPGKWHTC